MPFTYHWSDLVTLAKKSVRNIPTADIDAMHCDLVSSEMASRATWRPQVTVIPNGSIALVNAQQDYTPPATMYRLASARLTRIDTTVEQDVELDCVAHLPVDMIQVSPTAVRCISFEAGVAKLRLQSAVQIPAGTAWELRGEYEINPTKITATSQSCWFDDKYVNVAMAGLLYWLFKVAGDDRAGTAQFANGKYVYSGQLAEFNAFLEAMKKAEDMGGEARLFPAEPLATGRGGQVTPNIFGW